MSGLAELEVQYQRLVAERNALGARYEAGEKDLLPTIQNLNAQIRIVVEQIEALQNTASSGEIVRDDQQARVSNSNDVAPSLGIETLSNGRIQRPPETSTDSNALRSPPEYVNDFGTDPELKRYLQTQSTPPTSSRTFRDDAFGSSISSVAPQATTQGGVGAAGDDRSGSSVVSALNSVDFAQQIISQPNILDQYASYTYSASLYLVTKANYQRLLNTGSRDLSGAKLIVQSGGISQSTRSTGFDLDYYIDDIEMHSFIVGGGSRAAHNVSEVRMKVIEPNGISFIENIDSAVQAFVASTTPDTVYYENDGSSSSAPAIKKQSYTSQVYLLVIRFYGYDQEGNLVRGGKKGTVTDPNSFVEKFYPLVIEKVGFRIASKAAEYDLKFKAPQYQINGGQGRASLPFNFEFSGGTVNDILAGPVSYGTNQSAVAAGGNASSAKAAAPNTSTTTQQPVYDALGNFTGYETVEGRTATTTSSATTASGNTAGTQQPVYDALGNFTGYETVGGTSNSGSLSTATTSSATAPPKASAIISNKKTVRQGLMAALNEFQQEMVKNKKIEFADVFNIQFELPAMAAASIVLPGVNKSSTAMSTPGTAADQKLPKKQSMDTKSQNIAATAGMQIVQFIDMVLRNSSYISDQQVIVIDNKTGEETPGPGVNLKNTAWYKIGFKAVPMLDKYDTIRNDYAYQITYTISPYKLSQLYSPYFKYPTFNGVHKTYKYWFTGENTSVLSYEESLNNLFFIVLSNQNQGTTSNINELLKQQPYTASGQASQGGQGRATEPGANAADQLYSASDLKECNMSIVGDPAWLQQGEAFCILSSRDPNFYQPFLADGTINFDSQQVLFEIAFNTPRDYNLETGLIQPSMSKNSDIYPGNSENTGGKAKISRVYIAKECISNFRQGKFTQQLKGVLRVYKIPGQEPVNTKAEIAAKKASSVAAPSKSKAPAWTPKSERSSVTNPTPSSSIAKGVQQILQPTTNGENLTDADLRGTPVYNTARRGGDSDAAALVKARSASAAGTNNFSGVALPGIRVPNQIIAKDQ
jgi:hypothetical protein